jgi:hypothetical protein
VYIVALLGSSFRVTLPIVAPCNGLRRGSRPSHIVAAVSENDNPQKNQNLRSNLESRQVF